MQNKGFSLASIFPLCCLVTESVEHEFGSCKLAKWLWSVIPLKLGKGSFQASSIIELSKFLIKTFRGNGLLAVISRVPFCSGVYNIRRFEE